MLERRQVRGRHQLGGQLGHQLEDVVEAPGDAAVQERAAAAERQVEALVRDVAAAEKTAEACWEKKLSLMAPADQAAEREARQRAAPVVAAGCVLAKLPRRGGSATRCSSGGSVTWRSAPCYHPVRR